MPETRPFIPEAAGLGLYIHIPYCVHKCGYCDFNSYAGAPESQMEEYVSALRRELHHWQSDPRVRGRSIETLYFGGGTPSLLPTGALLSILEDCARSFSLAEGLEVTLEANPGTLTLEKLKILRSGGFNRLSLGIQALSDPLLRTLERIHTVAEGVEAVRSGRRAGFSNLSIDLMFAVPGQTLEQWRWTLSAAKALGPDHISCYHLTLEPGTDFYRLWRQGGLLLPPEEDGVAMLEETMDFLPAAGFEHYEISNFALPGRRSLHNQTYWRNQEYLGLGAGAHSFLGGERFCNFHLPRRYVAAVREKGSAVSSRERSTGATALGESFMMGLRLLEGIDLEELSNRYWIPVGEAYRSSFRELVEKGLVSLEGNCLKLTRKGILFSNEVFMALLSPPPEAAPLISQLTINQ
ncbi:MAG: radical SAM family heme chaperone HemW [Candidatus Tectomicrobia bacterium]|uniref:Heme chaperone HemW n=1 Tax=Tectimicrobiota bacterium TaxID=2528274 RepID=A0A932GN75_UNCTE|nr:radical SAM family heme chaperone HemW [Candidatus Tectomicrobia bacterium]